MNELERPAYVIFADDESDWHEEIERTKSTYIPKFKSHLKDCEIISVHTSDELFECLGKIVTSENDATIIVFLDLNFPSGKNGLETLNRMSLNENEKIRRIPVFVYSITQDPSEVASVFARNGAGFYHKMRHPETFWGALEAIDGTQGAKLPSLKYSDVGSDKGVANDLDNKYLLK